MARLLSGLPIVRECDYVDEPILIVGAWPANVNRPVGGVIDELVVVDDTDLDVADMADPRARRGKEALTADDVRWTADTRPGPACWDGRSVQPDGVPTGIRIEMTDNF